MTITITQDKLEFQPTSRLIEELKILGSIHFWKIYRFWENITTDKTVWMTYHEPG
ncbi:hypothetical protein [Nostoc sp. TCL26-01]|uniref:hypothetical protein n=1 Tax=Nostoc sp. TCL26-01 TaxID=2576904 RepID=UPI0015B9CF99|nr:hypothetical protein [Nostoc sp. TCL26-01]